jgi:hypothetical protein
MDLAGVTGLRWAAYDGVAALVDHRRPRGDASVPSVGTAPSDERRLTLAWFGEGYSAKARAYQVVCDWLKWQPNG